MLRVKILKSASAAGKYYSHGDYYGQEGVGVWYGKGAAELGFQGEFEVEKSKNFKDILHGKMPNGQVLGKQIKNGLERSPGADLTFSCPKSFSIEMLVYSDKERRQALEKALDTAVYNTLNYIEEKGYVLARKGKGGIEKEKLQKLIFATFRHTTNRNLEPQAHVHCFLANAAKCQDGVFRSVYLKKILDDMKNNKLLGQIFRNELGLEVKKLGYEITTKMLKKGGSSFELSHIHPDLIKAFSTRTQEIDELCKKYEVTTSEGRDQIVINSRKAKRAVEQKVLMQAWQKIESETMAKVEDKHNWKQPALKVVASPSSSQNEAHSSKPNIQYHNKITTHDIYKALYNRIPNVLPEFGFVNKGDHYVSTTTYKVDGSEGKKGKVHIYANNPGVIIDYTRGKKTIWDYFAQHVSPSTTKQELFNHLASLAGLRNDNNPSIKKQEPIVQTQETTKASKPVSEISHELWQHVQTYALTKIMVPNNQVTKYLQAERGYSQDIIKAMGIGYIPSKKELKEYLKSKGIADEDNQKLLKALGYMGASHKMVMPYYNKDKNIIGFVGRDIKYTDASEVGKYVYSKGFARSYALLNIEKASSNKPVIIVEGMLDAAHARAKGVENVLALGGTGLSNGQVELFGSLKPTEIILCMDNDTAGVEASKVITTALSAKLAEVTIKNATLPQGIKDADQLITEKGKQAFLKVIKNAEAVYQPPTMTTSSEKSEIIVEQRDNPGIINNETPVQGVLTNPVNNYEATEKSQIVLPTAEKYIPAVTQLEQQNESPNSTGEINNIEVIEYSTVNDPGKPALSSSSTDNQLLNSPQLTDTTNEQQELHLAELTKMCIEDVSHHKSVFTEEELLKKTLKFSVGKYSVVDLEAELRKQEKEGTLIQSGNEFTTKDLLDKEKQILKYARASLDQSSSILKEKHFESRCAKFEKREKAQNPDFQMNEQQRKALKHILTSSDKIMAIDGLPGTGKSTVLNAVRDISNKKIINLVGLGEKFEGYAPTAAAAKALAQSAKVESTTIHSILWKYKGYIEGRGTKESLNAMQAEFKNTIIFLDESSLASTNMMWQLLKLQEKFGFRLVMTGDVKQLGAVEAGKPYEQMLEIIPYAKIQTIIRQKDETHKQAVIAASQGNIKETFDIHRSRIANAPGSALLVNSAVRRYMNMNLKQRENTLLVSPTRRIRDKINNKIRIELRKENTLQGKLEKFTALRQKDMSTADLRFAPSFSRGDTVKFYTQYENGINRDDYLKVLKTNEITNSLTLEKNGKQYIFKLKSGVKYDGKFEVFEDLKLKLQEGLKIKFTKNNKKLGLINSETAIIQKMDKETITLKMEDESIKSFPKSQLKHIDYGYCVTVHSSQGKTYANTIAAICINKWLNTQKSWLVVLSRHKDRFLAIVEDANKLRTHLISNKGIEISAIEHAEKAGLNQGSKIGLQHNINKASMNIGNNGSTGSAKQNMEAGW